ncbi:MAG: DUF998 domain-containing protein [Candidatus Odinarchaeota archaeon]
MNSPVKKFLVNYYLLIAGFITGTLFTLALYFYVAEDRLFSFTTHFLSHLGTGSLSGMIFTMNIFVIVLLLTPYFLVYSRYLYQKGAQKVVVAGAFILILIWGLSMFAAAVFPYDQDGLASYNIHIFSASILFSALSLAFAFYSIAESSIKLKLLALTSILMFIAMGFFAVNFILDSYFFESYRSLTYLSEWLCTLTACPWGFVRLKLRFYDF